jgi:acetylglutamate kinase
MEKLFVIKIGGQVIDDESKLTKFLKEFSLIRDKKILVHGGGKLATELAFKLNVPQQLVNGRRITDEETLKIAAMVYAGLINKSIVAKLDANQCRAVGLCGADGGLIQAHRRVNADIDYGFVGDIDAVHDQFLQSLLESGISIVVAPITHDGKGQLLNTNADTIAQEIARSMSRHYEVQLVYSFEKSGVLLDAKDELTVIPRIGPDYYLQLKEEKKVFEGMIPKIDNAFAALRSGVSSVLIGKAEELTDLINNKSGTKITND